MSRPTGRPRGRPKGTTISFAAPATIADSANGLGAIPVGALIEVRGSPRNSRKFVVATSAAGALTVTPALITNEAAGPAITVAKAD